MEYTLVNGEKQLLENGLFVIAYPGAGHPLEESYPFPELWREVYQTVIREPKGLFNLYMAILDGFDESDIVAPEPYRQEKDPEPSIRQSSSALLIKHFPISWMR